MDEPLVVVEGLTFTYAGNAAPVLKNIHLEIHKGEFITITGPSGCGKSTLALCLAGFIPHHVDGKMQGSIVINGMDTREYPPAKLAGSIGLVQQDPEAQLCTLKVIDEVAFGPENLGLPRTEIEDRVEEALSAVNLSGLRNREVYSLSGGEKQRVAIASVLAMKPPLIILDEPTANLDPRGTEEVLQLIKELGKQNGIAILVIEHRLKQLIPFSDRMLVIKEGQILAEGEPAVVYEEYCRQQHLTSHCPGREPYEKTDAPPNLLPRAASGTEPTLRVEKISLNYGSQPILQDIEFVLYPGEITAVMGSNGSGKTSLLLSLLGIHKLNEGRIFLQGRNITRFKTARRARSMGLVFQNPNHQIFENTVWQEASLPADFLLPGDVKNDSEIESWLHYFELYPYKELLPFSLSLGEKKRLTLVSVLGYHPQILLLDEPLIGQDYHRTDLFWKAVSAHSQRGGVTLIVCHEPDFVQEFCDRILFFDQGRLLVDGPTPRAFEQIEAHGFQEYLPGRF